MARNAKVAKVALMMLLSLVASVAPALADDWIAQKLRGKVLQLVDGTWRPIARGDAVPETQVVRTLGNARVLFQHGSESVELGPDTQVQIFRRKSDGFTTVKQYFGEVTVEADVEKVRHFGVQTPFLAAVVKGTIFTVRSDDRGASVEVKRGAVAVTSEADHSSVTVRAGQEVSSSDDGTLEVSGTGTLPVVVDAGGQAVVAETSNKGGNSGNSGNGGNSGNNGNSGKGKNGDSSGKGDDDESGDDSSGKSGDKKPERDDSGNSGHGGGNDEDENEDD